MDAMHLRTGHDKRWGKGQYLLRCPTLKPPQQLVFHHCGPQMRPAVKTQFQDAPTRGWTALFGGVAERRPFEMLRPGPHGRQTRMADRKRKLCGKPHRGRDQADRGDGLLPGERGPTGPPASRPSATPGSPSVPTTRSRACAACAYLPINSLKGST